MRRYVCLILAAVMAFSALTSCSARPVDETGKASGTKETTTSDTLESTSETETTETSKTTRETSSVNPSGKIVPPKKNCNIVFPKEEVYDYKMDLKFDPNGKTCGGHVVFEFFNDSEDTWNELYMRDYPSYFDGKKHDAGVTSIDNIRDSRSGELSYQRAKGDNTVVIVKLLKPLEPGGHMTLEYDFAAHIPNAADRFGWSAGVFNVTNFYPILCEYVDGDWSRAAFFNAGECFYSEVSNYHVTLETPIGFTVASSGEEKGCDKSDSSWTYTFEASFVRDFVFCASDVFEEEQEVHEGVKINVLYNKDAPPVDDMDEVVDKCFDIADTSLKAFGEAFGRYPYGELDVILAPIEAGGMEYPNLVIITDFLCNQYMMANEPYDQLEVCLAHEIGHQWFMGIVGSNSGVEPWLDESITSYTEAVYYEYLGGGKDSLYNDPYSSKYNDLIERLGPSEYQDGEDDNDTKYTYLDQAYSEFKGENDYVEWIYNRGKQALYQMEEACGREEFHGFLREYVREYAFKNAYTSNFLKLLFDYMGTGNEKLNRLTKVLFRTSV